MTDLILVKDFAARLGVDRSSLLKSLKKRGVRLYDARSCDTNFQVGKAIAAAVAAEIELERGQLVVIGDQPAGELAGIETRELLRQVQERLDELKRRFENQN